MLHQALRNGLRLLMETRGFLAELPMLFTDKGWLRRRLAGVKDCWVRHYFAKVWLPWPSDRAGFPAYLTSKLSPFVEDRILRNIVGQRGRLDLAKIFSAGKILLVNLAPGRIGQLNCRLLGMLLLHIVHEMLYRRAAVAVHVYVYVDEFHEMVTPAFPTQLAAARKFGAGFTIAHQGLEQLATAIRDPLLGNVGSLAIFRQGVGFGAHARSENTLATLPRA